MNSNIGKSVYRKEGLEKVAGTAKYTDDYSSKNMLHIKLVTSPYGHAKILNIDTGKALAELGVRAIIVGQPFPLTGEEIKDRSDSPQFPRAKQILSTHRGIPYPSSLK